MNELLLSTIAFIITLGLLVTAHEFGHFWVARRLGVKVLRFSVGFGTPLWSRRWGPDQTEYTIGALPLGGYVNMLDETEGPVEPSELHRAFNRQGVARRMAIVIAGPLANLLFAVIAYWLMFVIGISGARPLVGMVDPGTPAALAGLLAGEEIVAVAGRLTPTWEAVSIALLQNSLDPGAIRLATIDTAGQQQVRDLNLTAGIFSEPNSGLRRLGLRPGYPRLAAKIGLLEAGGAASTAGFTPDDRIIKLDDHHIEYWEELVEYVRARPGQAIQVEVERPTGRRLLTLTPAPSGPQRTVGRIGASVHIPEGYDQRLRAELRYPPGEALGAAFIKVWEMSALTLRLLTRMAWGEASVDNISGPISIAQLAGKSAAIGFTAFLSFLGLVSLSLGILNLLPIPVLDGGHLLYYLIEVVTGAPLSERLLTWGQKLGTAVLLALTALALFNDFNRIFGS